MIAEHHRAQALCCVAIRVRRLSAFQLWVGICKPIEMSPRRLKISFSVLYLIFCSSAIVAFPRSAQFFLFLSSLFLATFSSLWLVFLACPAVGRMVETTFQTIPPPIWY